MMKQYYFYLNDEQVGPLELDEIQQMGICRDTMAWHDGLAEWQPAETIQELKHLFKATPPPFPSSPKMHETNLEATTSVVASTRKINKIKYLVIVILIAIGVVAFNSYNNSKEFERQQLEMQIQEQARIARELQIKELTRELSIAAQNLEAAKKELHDLNSFHFLRSQQKRHEEVSAAEEVVNSWQNKVNNLQNQLNTLQ